MLKKFRVCKFGELQEGGRRAVRIMAKEIAVFKINGEIRAIDGLCKHMKAPLVSSGKLDGAVLTCSWHGWRYNISTGDCLTKPLLALRSYEIEIADGEIFVKLELP